MTDPSTPAPWSGWPRRRAKALFALAHGTGLCIGFALYGRFLHSTPNPIVEAFVIGTYSCWRGFDQGYEFLRKRVEVIANSIGDTLRGKARP